MQTVDQVPTQGSAHDLIERLCAYIGPVVPEWEGKLRPASESDLLRLGTLAKIYPQLSFPASYRVWALTAGADDGGLVSTTLGTWVSVKDVIEYYEELYEFEPDLINSDLPVVMMKKVGDEYSLDLRVAEGEPSVRESSGGEDLGLFSADWERLVFQCAIETCEKRRLDGLRIYGSSSAAVRAALSETSHADASTLISEYLQKQGLVLPWVNDTRHVYGIGEDASVLVNLGRSGAAPFVVVSRNRKRERELGEGLAELIDAKPAARDQWR